jgi:hypothetical protein
VDSETGVLLPIEQYEIGMHLYALFRDDAIFKSHKESFKRTYWNVEEIGYIQKWLSDSTVMRRVDKKWRSEILLDGNPIKGFLKELVKIVVQGLLRSLWTL